jgi:hypothetical protein
MRKVLRILTRSALVLLGLIVLGAVFVSMQQRIFRYRAEHLLADMQAIALHKTGWAQAQAVMHRWGAWEHYDGACTATNCKYAITLYDASCSAARLDESNWREKAERFFLYSPVYRWLGGRPATFYAAFIVQDGTIWRTFLHFMVEVPPHTFALDDEWGYSLMATAQSRSSLNGNRIMGSHWILGGDDQLADHPYYKGGRPGGCEICMSAEVTYSISTPQDEIRRLTAFNFDCLTRWWPCLRVEDILPASRPWHLYYLDSDPPEPPARPARPCDIPVWALGRDAISIFSVEALSASMGKDSYDGSPYEKAQADLVETIKGTAPWPAGTILTAYPYSGDFINPPFDPPETLTPGKRYLALLNHAFHEFDFDRTPPGLIDGVPGIRLERCGILEDTPQNRLELQRGILQNDHLRIQEF